MRKSKNCEILAKIYPNQILESFSGHDKHSISFEIFKFGKSDHIFDKKLTEKHILSILPLLL